MGRGLVPRIAWGAGFTNSLVFGWPLDEAKAYSLPRPPYEVEVSPGGVETAWLTAHNQMLDGVVRWIPGVDTGGVTGWDGATGWRAFLEWARAKNQFRFIPNQAVLGTFFLATLHAPLEESGVENEDDFTRRFRISIRRVDDQPITGY